MNLFFGVSQTLNGSLKEPFKCPSGASLTKKQCEKAVEIAYDSGLVRQFHEKNRSL